jgi:hypothetical protein
LHLLAHEIEPLESPESAVWLAQVQCGIVKTSCWDQSKLLAPMVDFPCPATTRQTALCVVRLARVVTPFGRRAA